MKKLKQAALLVLLIPAAVVFARVIDSAGREVVQVVQSVAANLLASIPGLELSQGSTTSGQKGPLVQGAVSTSDPTYTNGQTSPFSLTTAGGVRVSGTMTLSGTSAVNVSQVGGSAVVADPCMREARIPISISQTGGTQLITGTASERIFICSMHLVTATAQNIALVSGTGTVCATSPSGVVGFGGATAATGWNFAANGGIQMGHSDWSYGKTDTDADNVCLLQSGAGQISGGLTYVSAANF